MQNSLRYPIVVAAFGGLASALLPFNAPALDLNIGGSSIGVGLKDGVSLDVDVGNSGSGISVGASVGSSGVDASVSVGGTSSGGTTPPSSPDTPTTGGVTAASMNAPTDQAIREAKRLGCITSGRRDVYRNYLVYDGNGRAVGVVKSVEVSADMALHAVTFTTLETFAKPAKCLKVVTSQAKIGTNFVQIPYTGNDLHKALAKP